MQYHDELTLKLVNKIWEISGAVQSAQHKAAVQVLLNSALDAAYSTADLKFQLEDNFNCTFHTFKPNSGKWKYSGRGMIDAEFWRFQPNYGVLANHIHKLNGGNFPGMSCPVQDLTFVVLPDAELDFGWPMLVQAENW